MSLKRAVRKLIVSRVILAAAGTPSRIRAIRRATLWSLFREKFGERGQADFESWLESADGHDRQLELAAEYWSRRTALRQLVMVTETIRVIAFMRRGRRRKVSTKAEKPPMLAESLLALCTPAKRVEHVVGDMDERFFRECKKYGVQRAKRLYWAQVLRSTGPLAIRAIVRTLKWGVVVEAIKRPFFG